MAIDDAKFAAFLEVTLQRIFVETAFKVIEEHPELELSKEALRVWLIKEHPEWLPDLKKEEMQ